MELEENKIKEIERLRLLFHLPEFWEKERAITTMEALRAIESEDRDADSVLLVDSYLGANESLNKVTFKFDASQRLRDKWEKEESMRRLILVLRGGLRLFLIVFPIGYDIPSTDCWV